MENICKQQKAESNNKEQPSKHKLASKYRSSRTSIDNIQRTCSTRDTNPSSECVHSINSILSKMKAKKKTKFEAKNPLSLNKGRIPKIMGNKDQTSKKFSFLNSFSKPSPNFGKNKFKSCQEPMIQTRNTKKDKSIKKPRLPSALFESKEFSSRRISENFEEEYISSQDNQLVESVYTLNLSDRDNMPTFTEYFNLREGGIF